MFLNPNNFFQFELRLFYFFLDMKKLQEQVKKAFCYQKLFWPFTVWINCFSDLKSFSRSQEQFFLTVGQKNFGNKIPFITYHAWKWLFSIVDRWFSLSSFLAVPWGKRPAMLRQALRQFACHYRENEETAEKITLPWSTQEQPWLNKVKSVLEFQVELRKYID